MARVKGAMMTRKRRNKTLKLAKGYWGAKSKHFKMAKQAVMKSGNYAYVGRKQKKRNFRQLWITRISAAAKLNGMNYSTLMNGLKKADITLNRKMLSEMAIKDPVSFKQLVDIAKTLRTSRLVRNFMNENTQFSSALNTLARNLMSEKDLEERIFSTFDDDLKIKRMQLPN